MTFSDWRKIPFSGIVSTAALVVIASSCSRDSSPRVSLDGDATFIVRTPVELVQSKQTIASSEWAIPSQNVMTFRACLKDVAKLQPIVLQSFAVQTENGPQTLGTDEQGCLTWNEEIPFDFTQPETFIQSAHSIQGLGPHKGLRDLPLAVNPWQNFGSTAFADMRESPTLKRLVQAQSISQGLRMARQSAPSEQKARIFIDSIGFNGNENRYANDGGATFSRQLTFTPKFTRTGLKGEPVIETISRGRFEIALTLLERSPDNANDLLLVLSEQTLQATAENQKLKLDVSMPLSRKPAPKSTIELAMRVTPIEAPFDLLPEEGYVRIASLRGDGSPEFMRLTDGFKPYLNKAKTDTAAFQAKAQMQVSALGANSCSDGSEQLGFYIQSITVENRGVTGRSQNENFPNQVLSSYVVCLGNSMTRTPIVDQSFEVQLTDSSGPAAAPQLVESKNSCLRFTDPVSFDYFAAENWIEKTLKITSHEAPYQDITREFPIQLDPWANDGNFFWDCRRGEKPEFKTEPARLEMIDFKYNFGGRDLEVDPQLNLTLNRHYLVQITPRLKRSTGFDGLVRYESLVDGRYHLRMILLAPNHDKDLSQINQMGTDEVLKNFKYMSSFEADVTTRDGSLVEDVVLPIEFADTPILMSRAAIIVQLSPLGSESKLVSRPFYSPFLPMEAFGMWTLLQDKSMIGKTIGTNEKMISSLMDLTKLIEVGKQSRDRQRISGSSVDAITKHFSLVRPDREELAQVGLTPAALHSLFASSALSSDNAKKLCTLLGEKTSHTAPAPASSVTKGKPASCETNPIAALEVARTRHLEALSTQPEVNGTNYSTLNVSAAISVSQSTGTSTSDGQNDNKSTDLHGSVGTSVGGGVNFFGFFKAGAEVSGGKGWSKGTSWYKSQSSSQSKDGSGSATVAHSRSFAVEELIFGFQAGTRECITVRLKKSTHAGTMVCEEDAKSIRNLTESFYLLTEQNAGSSSPLRDARTSKESPWIKAIRGKKAFEALQRVLTDKSKTLVLSADSVETNSLNHLDEALDQFAKTRPRFSDGAFPAVIY